MNLGEAEDRREYVMMTQKHFCRFICWRMYSIFKKNKTKKLAISRSTTTNYELVMRIGGGAGAVAALYDESS